MPPPRILLIEDGPVERSPLHRLLQTVGLPAEVRTVHTPAEFTAALTHGAPAVAIIPIRRVDFPAATALALARDHAPAVPCIVVTDRPDEPTAAACWDLGAWDCVPASPPRRLIASLRAALAERAIDAKPGSGAESVDSSPNGAAIASSARHELNNQLAIMRMFADVLALSPGLTPEQIAKAREIAAAADRATQIVRRLTGGHHRSRD